MTATKLVFTHFLQVMYSSFLLIIKKKRQGEEMVSGKLSRKETGTKEMKSKMPFEDTP